MPTIRGADAALVRDAVESGEPLPGSTGFAGELDGALVRDVLGREPLYVERAALPLNSSADTLPSGEMPSSESSSEPQSSKPPTSEQWSCEPASVEPADWAFDPTELGDPESFPAGHVLDERGLRERWTLPSARSADRSDGTGGDPRDAAIDDPRAAVDDPRAAIDNLRAAIDNLRAAIDDALAALAPSTPVAFSGGVDSGLVASATDGPLYVAGFPDSHDVAAAREAAAAMGRELRVVEIDHDDVERAVRAVAAATGRTNAMDVAIAVPLALVAERVAADGFDRLALGQGADELFGGYAKVETAPTDDRVAADTVVGARDEVLASLPEQLPRDVLAIRAGADAHRGDDATNAGSAADRQSAGSVGSAAGVEPVVPLLHDDVVEAALGLPSDLLVDGERRKVALREVAAERLPASVAERDKKALQYGSLVSRELDRLARQAGYKRRMDDHVGQYVADLVDE